MADDSYMPSIDDIEVILEAESQGQAWPGRAPVFGEFPPEFADKIWLWLARVEACLPRDGGDHTEFVRRLVQWGANSVWCAQYAALNFGMTADGVPWRDEAF